MYTYTYCCIYRRNHLRIATHPEQRIVEREIVVQSDMPIAARRNGRGKNAMQ